MKLPYFVSPLSITALFNGWQHQSPIPSDNPIVETDSGTYRGLINGSTPLVRQFLGVPFAQPPIGELRWAPPKKIEKNASHFYDATRYPPSCAQHASTTPSVYNTVTTEYIISGPISEDCLALSIWTPSEAKNLPVTMFITGGGFQSGGVEVKYQLPHNWVQRTQAHIVVTINYRLSIFGYPNALGLESNNVGLLDQRAALEWVQANIEAFGGDPSRITMWGQSAGAASVDYQNFAFYDDPIVTGFFAQSGTALLPTTSPDATRSNFTFVASSLGCDYPDDPAEELECMRQILWKNISDFVGAYQDNHMLPTIGFDPVPDGVIVFTNYTDRYAQNKVSQRPAIISTCEKEGNSLVPYHYSGINETFSKEVTLGGFLCPAAKTSQLRTTAGLTTYRYQYSGNFSNVSPLPWMGPYHVSDLPMLFATHQEYTHGKGNSTPFELDVSTKIEDLVFSFMLDPLHGPEKHGWEPYTSGKMLRFAADGEVVQIISVEEVDGVCAGLL